jgi:tetratricopeptide (TPR) repeat protein
LALAHLRAGNAQAAADAVRENPNDAESLRVHGLALAEWSKPEAGAEFDAAVEVSGGKPIYLAARAEYLVRIAATRKDDESDALLARAEADAKRAIEIDASFAPAHVALANVYAATGRWFEMNESCERAVAANSRLVSAYLRGADDLSPKAARRYRMLQEALLLPLDLRELEGFQNFAFGPLIADLQRIVSVKIKEDVVLFIDYESVPPEARGSLRDAKVNLNSLMDVSGDELLKNITFETILDTLCYQVGLTYIVTPEHINLVDIGNAGSVAQRTARLIPAAVVNCANQIHNERRRLFLEQALERTLDLEEFRGGGDFMAGQLLKDLQVLLSRRMNAHVPLYLNYRTFPPESRQTLRDSRTNLSKLYDAGGDRFLPNLRARRVIEDIAKQLNAGVRVAADYIEIVGNEVLEAKTERAKEKANLDAELGKAKKAFLAQREKAAKNPKTTQELAQERILKIVYSILGIRSNPVRFNPFDGFLVHPEWTEFDFSEYADWQQFEKFYIELYQEAIDPETLIKAKPRPEALRWLERGIAAIPDSAELHYARGQIHLEMGEFDKAIGDFTKAIELNPGHAEAIRMRKIAIDAKDRPIPKKEELN